MSSKSLKFTFERSPPTVSDLTSSGSWFCDIPKAYWQNNLQSTSFGDTDTVCNSFSLLDQSTPKGFDEKYWSEVVA